MLCRTRHRSLRAIAEESIATLDHNRRRRETLRLALHSMWHFDQVTDVVNGSTGRQVVRHVLASFGGWRGPTARSVKAELNRILNGVD